MADITAGFPFLKLPQELRHMVYKELLVMPGMVEMPWKTGLRVKQTILDESGRIVSFITSQHPLVFGIFLVSKEIRQDALSTYFGSNKFNPMTTEKLAKFLSRIGPEACNAIREISILYHQGKFAPKAFKLLAQCGSLRKINITIDTCRRFPYCIPALNRDGNYAPLLKGPGMDALLKVRGIQELDVEFFQFGAHRRIDQDEADRKEFLQALQILKQPRDSQKQRRLPPRELWRRAPMRTRARTGRKE